MNNSLLSLNSSQSMFLIQRKIIKLIFYFFFRSPGFIKRNTHCLLFRTKSLPGIIEYESQIKVLQHFLSMSRMSDKKMPGHILVRSVTRSFSKSWSLIMCATLLRSCYSSFFSSYWFHLSERRREWIKKREWKWDVISRYSDHRSTRSPRERNPYVCLGLE